MATREITDEQAGEIAERLEDIAVMVTETLPNLDPVLGALRWRVGANVAEIRRLLGFPA